MTKGLTKRVLLVICDGMGESDNTVKNAVKDSNTPTLDSIKKNYPFTTLTPGGELVGLPKGVAGNSEVGHMNLGAGRSVRQDLVRINEAIENDTLKDMIKFKELIDKTLAGSKRLHLMGLLSDGGVHSHIDHLKAILNILKTYPQIEVYLHAYMDGRDTPIDNGMKYLKDILDHGGFTFASMQGRSIGMDRDRRWSKMELSYKNLTGQSGLSSDSPIDYLQDQYNNNIFDEFITPAIFNLDSAIKAEDSVFFFNFRPDRAKQISEVLCSDRFTHFDNSIRPNYFLCMSPYIDEEFPELPILFNREKVKGGIIEYLSSLGKKTFKIAETEKYAHVTYFFNGGKEKPFKGEEWKLINSPRDVQTYNDKPEMSALEVLEALKAKLKDKETTFFTVNFANPDMVGHTGDYEAAIKAMETIDKCIKELVEVCEKENIAMLITADHGNCDQMVYEDGSPNTSHSKADVPFILVHSKLKNKKVVVKEKNKALMDVAPTVLHLLGIDIPSTMKGETIFKE